MLRFIISAGLMLSVSLASAASQTTSLRYVDIAQATADAVIIDTRARAVCEQRSLAGAHCLPAADLLGPHGELPSFADIYWALGTAGLDGSETILVSGDKPAARNFVAGLLYLCGQKQVEVLTDSIDKTLRAKPHHTGHGQGRAILRQRIYRAGMRDQLLVLPGELSSVKAKRNHVDLINADQYTADAPELAEHQHDHHAVAAGNSHIVIYAKQPRAAIALFTRLLAGHSEQARNMRVVPVAMSNMLNAVASQNR